MSRKLWRWLSIVLIAAVLFVNFGSAGTVYASEVDAAGKEQMTESADEATDESDEDSQESDGLTENAEKDDEDAGSAGSDEADIKDADEEKTEGDAAKDQDAAENEESGKSDDDAPGEETAGEAADEEGGTEDAAGEDVDGVKAPADGNAAEGASEKEAAEDAAKKQEAVQKEAAKASADELGIDGRGGLVIQKQIQGIPEGDYNTKFKIRLWTDSAPISGFTIETADATYVTDKNGEFTYDMTITVNGTQGGKSIGFTVPAPCNYSVEEVECDSPLAVSTEKNADTGTTVVNRGITTNWYTKRGSIELTAKTAYFETDYPQFMPDLEHEIYLTYNGQPLSGTFPASGSFDSVEFVDGKATVSVKMARVSDSDADKLTIYGIPYGTNAVVNLTDPMRGYFPQSSVKTVQGTVYTVLTADCYNGPYGTSYMSGDQYFYYYDSTGKVDEVKFYFKNRHDNPTYPFADTKMSHTYLDDGTKVYYFDLDGDEHEIVVGNGEKVVCACFPCYSTDNIGTRYLPVDNVRMNRLFQSGFTNEAGERDESDSWSGSYTKRGLACFSMEAYTMETLHKTDRKGVPVDCKFCLTNSTANNKKKYSLIHHDSYEYGGETYSNVYEIDLDGELKDFDSEDESTVITPDENGYFHILYPRGISSSFGRADIVDPDNGALRGAYLYELESDDDHYIGQNYWELASNTYSNYLKYENAVTYDGRTFNTRAKLHISGIDPATFDYNKLDLGELENPVFTHEMEMVNGSYPYIEKQITGDGYSYDSDPSQKFTFDVYYEGELVKTFELAAGESYHLSPSNIPTISQNTLNKHIIKERGTDGWIDERSRSSNRWIHRDDGYNFNGSYNMQTEQDLVIVNCRESKELMIQKSVQDAASDEEATTRFKVTLWDENEDGSKAPIKNFTTTVGEETITGDENGEFFIDIVTTGTESASKTIKVPANCHYKIEEVSCSLKGAKEISKTNEQGVMEADVEAVWKNALLNSLSVSKVDITDGEELEGAHIQILDSKGNVVEEWDSTEEAHVVEGLLKIGEEYTLKETVAPDGYTIAAKTTFKIDETGKVTTTGSSTTDEDGNTVLLVEDTKTHVSVSKVDIADGEELEGAHIQILDSKGTVVDEWDSTKEAHVVEGLLKVGEKYTLKETVAPESYTIAAETTFTIEADGSVTTTGSTTTDEKGNTVLLVEDSKTSVSVSKVDIADGEELEGAHIQILDSKGTVADEWDSAKEPHVVEGLKVGEEYTLKETVAPDGYTIAAETTFTIDETGKVTTTGSKTTDEDGNTVLLVNDAKTRVKVSKVDITDGKELEGAHIQILDSKGKIFEEWDSTKEPHVVEGLKTGEEYTLKETVAPDGYTIAAETTFTLNEKGEVTSSTTTVSDGALLVEDAKTHVEVSKVDITDGKELEGAHIQILDSKGSVADEWDSTTKPHVIEGLKTGEKYTLKETVAPDGYTIASETTFTIDDTGKVTSTGTTTTDKDGNTVLLVEDAKTHVEVSKVDIADGKELEGAHIQILDSKGNVVDEWNSTKEPHVIEGLKTGEEYTLKETVAPEGYTIATETTFTIDENGKVTTTGSVTEDGILLVEDAKTHVEVSKVDIANGEELEGAHIQILDSEGNVVDEWDSTKEPHVIEGLKVGEKYTLKETVAPEGYLIATETTFTIDKTGKVTTTGSTTTDKNGNTILLVEDAREGETGIAIGGKKELQGGTLKADQFTFVLKDENGKTIGEAKNDADGNFTFARLAYKLADLNGEKEKVFTYKVSEVKGSDANITYDENEITVKVTVTDKGGGTITAAADKTRDKIKFVNKVKEKKSSKKTSKKSSTKSGTKTVKKTGSRTGDEAPLGILFGSLGIGAVGLIALLAIRRRRNSEQ